MIAPDFGSRILVIVEITEKGYKAISTNNKKRYNLTDSQIQKKIGTISENSPFLLSDSFDDNEGSEFCLRQARKFPAESTKWFALSKLKNGDDICLVHRKTIYPHAQFLGINLKKPKYPIRAKIKNSSSYDFSLMSFILPE
jgi:hypothetical protein